MKQDSPQLRLLSQPSPTRRLNGTQEIDARISTRRRVLAALVEAERLGSTRVEKFGLKVAA